MAATLIPNGTLPLFYIPEGCLNNPNKVFEFYDSEGNFLAGDLLLVGVCTHNSILFDLRGDDVVAAPFGRQTYSFMPARNSDGACTFWCDNWKIMNLERFPA